ncbi:MAG: MBL fold metallo-hydrolase [Acidobacteria bacterium]|nr:MBL fold metallo-hydrolase [Acidobacteriota bacterium]
MRKSSPVLRFLPFAFFLLTLFSQTRPALDGTRVVILGTGNPNADPERSGPAVAIMVNGSAYLVDCGPGVVRRAAAAARDRSFPALQAPKLNRVFITHLHSDHTLGYPDLIFSPWVLGRDTPLEAYGPRGLQEMTDAIEKAWRKDVNIRVHGLEQANPTGYKVRVHEITPGVVYKDANVTVTAIPVKHGTWDAAFGYRFQTADRTIVVSGDTAPAEAIATACSGCDVLLHEIYNPRGPALQVRHWREYFRAFHTAPAELARIALAAHPKLLVLYHQVLEGLPEQDLIDQMKENYSGAFVSARDLDVY